MNPKSSILTLKWTQLIRMYERISQPFIQDMGPKEHTAIRLGPVVQVIAAELMRRSGKFTSRVVIGISIISLLISMTALGISLTSARTQSDWMESQLHLLRKIESKPNTTVALPIAQPALTRPDTTTNLK